MPTIQAMNFGKLKTGAPKPGFLDGQMLIAMPTMQDERFARSVIYVCAHSSDGAMGIVLNRKAPDVSFRDLLVQLDIIEPEQAIRLPNTVSRAHVLKGGPVETSRGFVLHSPDFFVDNATLPIDDGVSLTATLDILKAIVRGDGPRMAVLALGYAGWSPGQLEREMQDNGWLHCPTDRNMIFDADLESKYDRAMRMIGIDPAMLSSEAGHA